MLAVLQKYFSVDYGGHDSFGQLADSPPAGREIVHIVPRMRARGFSSEAIDKLLVNNPRDAFTFAELEA
jgi:predicted metal-dependent phosphotriesterase family hydrolase